MIQKRGKPQALGNREMANRERYARALWPTLRGITSILASGGFIAFLAGFLHGKDEGMGLPVFVVGTFVLAAITPPPDALPALDDEGAGKLTQRRIPWSLFSHAVIIGIGFNWACVFLAFSRRYALLSLPVIGTTALIMALYAAIGLLVAYLAGGNWQKTFAFFAIAPILVGATLLRLRILPLW